jgi:hypothetical protein
MQNTAQKPLIGPSEAKALLGYRCRTSHVLRNLEKRGLIKAIRLNSRCLRYDPDDIRRLIADCKGGAA